MIRKVKIRGEERRGEERRGEERNAEVHGSKWKNSDCDFGGKEAVVTK